MNGTAAGLHWTARKYALNHTYIKGRERSIDILLPRAGTPLKKSSQGPGPRWHNPAYGWDRAEILLIRGTALQYSCVWPGSHWTFLLMDGAACKYSLLWSVPHANINYYGRYHTQTLIFMDDNDTPFGPYKIISKGWEDKWRFPCLQAFISQSGYKAITLYFHPNLQIFKRSKHLPQTRYAPTWTGHISNFLVYGKYAYIYWM